MPAIKRHFQHHVRCILWCLEHCWRSSMVQQCRHGDVVRTCDCWERVTKHLRALIA